MNCKEAIPFMHEYLDGELSGEPATELKKHLMACADCRERYRKLEKADAMLGSLQRVAAPKHMTTAHIMQRLPAPAKRVAWMKWFRRHPAISVAAVFVVVMLSSFVTLWDNDSQLMVKGSDLDQIVIHGNTVVVPEGHTVQGNLIVEKGTVQVDGKINGNLIVIDGSYALASTAHISGEITKVNQAVEWLWFKVSELFSMATR